MQIIYFLKMARPANVVTAIADILAGAAIAGAFSGNRTDVSAIALLVLATTGLYAGGIVFNDIFDLEVDRLERPERMLPSDKVALPAAYVFGGSLLAMGVVSATFVSPLSGLIALAVAMLALCYDKFGKHSPVLGPLNMGLCRAGNLLLGVSLSYPALLNYWWIGVIPILFIGAVTLTSQKENTGSNKRSIMTALGIDVGILVLIITISYFTKFELWPALLFIVLWFAMNARAKTRAILGNTPANIQRAVKMGVISLIPLDASLAAGFSQAFPVGLLVLALLPCSLFLAKRFAVT